MRTQSGSTGNCTICTGRHTPFGYGSCCEGGFVMNMAESYGQFCPVAMAAEIFCTRWTPLILRELAAGSTRFNDLKRGVPRISPTLLSKRLKQLEAAGIVRRLRSSDDESVEYQLTPAGEELKSVVLNLGFWGQRWIEAQSSLKN